MAIIRRSIVQAARLTPARTLRPFSSTRIIAKENMDPTGGQGSPGTSGNVSGNPQSASQESSQINQSRGAEHPGTQGEGSPDTASIQQPHSQGSAVSGQHGGEESTGAHEAMKPDPDASQSEKREAVEQQGQKPLDAADK
ncbi:hypothetical protein H2203_002245 [Taxawa tesnikishii (nom. ined.)]|nr:hypothetical protein H2203_002245 [Dothideales sp. JES 119]